MKYPKSMVNSFTLTGIDIYEFNGEKIQLLRYIYDRLPACKQVVKGFFARIVVGVILNRWEKGLH